MSDDIKHAKITTATPLPNGDTELVKESYYETLTHRTQEIERKLQSSRKTILADVVDCIKPLLNGSIEVNINVQVKNDGTWLITKRELVKKEDFKRR